MRVTIRVTPGARRPGVGGPGGPDPAALAVRVAERAVDGRATDAALAALADALGVRPRQVALVRGATSRTKVVEVDGPEDVLVARVAALRAGAG